MKKLPLLFVALVLTFSQDTVAQDAQSPYTSFQNRTIKSLSAEDIDALLSGSGMGFALAAELNGYPGPRHVLDLADSLRLNADQVAQVQEVFDDMSQEAASIGSNIVELERQLDSAFAGRTISAETLVTLTNQIAELNGELRSVHLGAHLALDGVLTQDQIRAYLDLRGYGHGGHQHRGH